MTSPESRPDSPRTGGRRRPGRPRTAGRIVADTAVYIILGGAAVLTLAPFALSFLTAFKTPAQFASESALSLPHPFSLVNFRVLLTNKGFIAPLVVTIQMVAVILVGQLTFSIMAAFAFARLHFPGRDLLFWGYLSTMMVPQVVTVIPLYTMFAQAGMRNTFWSLVLPFVLGSPYAVFLLREYFRGIPQELVDAARIDGVSTWQILWRIVVPLARPIIATLTIITVVSNWNAFLWPLIITTGPTWQTLTVATAALQSQYNGNWTLVMAATTLSMAPLLALFAVFQRHIVNSISLAGFR